MSIPTLKHNILSKGKLDYSTRSARKFWEGKIVVNLNGTQVFSFGKPSSPLSFPSTWRGQHRVARARGVACPKDQCWGLYCMYCTRPRLATLGTFGIRFFVENGKPQNVTWPRPCGHVCSLQFTFEPQEGLPAVSDLRQGFLPQKIVQPRV